MLLWLAALGGYRMSLRGGRGGWSRLAAKASYITIPGEEGGRMILFLAVINSFKVFREAYRGRIYPNDRIYLPAFI